MPTLEIYSSVLFHTRTAQFDMKYWALGWVSEPDQIHKRVIESHLFWDDMWQVSVPGTKTLRHISLSWVECHRILDIHSRFSEFPRKSSRKSAPPGLLLSPAKPFRDSCRVCYVSNSLAAARAKELRIVCTLNTNTLACLLAMPLTSFLAYSLPCMIALSLLHESIAI